jgi:flagellar biosynthesis regulator FlaF
MIKKNPEEERAVAMATDQLKELVERVEKLLPANRENIVKEILQKIEAAEWDEKWDETLASPESIMDFERICAKMDHDHATGNDKDYLTDTDADLEKLFRV